MAVEVLTHTPMPLMYDGTSYRQNPNNEMDTYFAESNEPISTSMSTIEKVEEVDGICYTINALISKQQCGALQKWSNEIGFEKAKVNIDFKGVDNPAVRNNYRTLLDLGKVADDLFKKLIPVLPEIDGMKPKRINNMTRVLRYSENQQFTAHKDGSYEQNGEKSMLTLQIYLTDDFSAGETTFLTESGVVTARVKPVIGKALIFSHDLLHSGDPPVDCNELKYALRTEVMYS